MDILNVLYNRIMRVSPETFRAPDRDHYIQSKGHCAEALFIVLADRGFFPGERTGYPKPLTARTYRAPHPRK